MSPAKSKLLLHSVAIGAMVIGGNGAALAADAPLIPAEQQAAPAQFELIDSSRLGCGETLAMWTSATGGSQCQFDDATRGARVTAMQELGKGSIETYATFAHATAGAFTPDELLTSPEHRSTEATDFFLVGLKGRALDERVKFTAEFASTKRLVEGLVGRDWSVADGSVDSGTSALVRLEAKLASSPWLNWSMTAELRSVSDDYEVGRSTALSRYAAMPGRRIALSSKARIGELGLFARIDQSRTPYGESASRKAGLDLHGLSLQLLARDTSVTPSAGSSLRDSDTRTTSVHLGLDTTMLAMSLFPSFGELPFLVPTMVNVSVRSGETESRYLVSTERFRRSSHGVDATWETPLGETVVSYWREARSGLTPGAQSRSSELTQASHYVRRGNWRFGLDASLTQDRADGSSGYNERSWSFGQSVAYSAPDGPEFRLSLGQDRGFMRMRDDSFAYSDRHSQITASLDLSRYLQKRFERPDLRLTLDYRKALERSGSEMIYDELVEHWVDNYRREGLLMSFGMKL